MMRPSPGCSYFATVLFLAVLPLHSGCTPAASQAPAAPSKQPTSDWADRETWDVLYIEGVKVGHGFTRRSLVREGNEELVRTVGGQELAVERSGQAIRTVFELASLETPDGQVRSFQTEAQLGPSPMLTKGHLVTGRMLIETTQAGQKAASEIPWKQNFRGFFAVDDSLLAQPMKPGERRTLQVLQPIFNQVATVELVARTLEQTKLLSGTRELLRIDSTTLMPGEKPPGIASTYWIDATGETLKVLTPMMNLVAYRSTKEQALSKSNSAALDLNLASIVKLDRPLERPHDARRIRYLVQLDQGDPASVFVNDRAQKVKAADEHAADLTVRAVRPETPPDGFSVDTATPAEEFVKANSFIQSDDPRIVAMAREAAGPQIDPWKTAVALEDFVHRKITAKNYSQAFATAAEVAKSLEGDCTEHAVLLAALARARGIPARVAIGLVYVPEASADGGASGNAGAGFLYHMWTEVYVAGGWVGLDGTLGKGGAGPAHLKLATSSLHDATAYSSMLPVAQVLGRLKIEVLEVE